MMYPHINKQMIHLNKQKLYKGPNKNFSSILKKQKNIKPIIVEVTVSLVEIISDNINELVGLRLSNWPENVGLWYSKVKSLVKISVNFHRITFGSKIIRALAIILAIFLWFECQFLPSHVCLNSMKSKDHDLTNIYFIKLHFIWVFLHEFSQVLE